jgi:hypothetical protein
MQKGVTRWYDLNWLLKELSPDKMTDADQANYVNELAVSALPLFDPAI